MTEAILLLRIEHHQASDLLASIENQIENPEGEVDLELMQSIADYFADYPDQCHHPVEDLVFRKLEKRDPVRAAAVGEILDDHRSISEITEKLAATVKQASNGGDGDQAALRSVMREFVERYRAHMESEEHEFFPLALELLRDADWAEVEHQLFDRRDPLYNREVEGRFRRLRSEIEQLAAASFRRGAFMREAAILQQLDGIAAFNEEMARVGCDYRMSQHPEGGYGLEKNGRSVIDIPKCSPSRAAWCAYFYVAAQTGRA